MTLRLKRLASALLAFSILLPSTTSTHAQTRPPNFTLLSPTSPTTFKPGDVVKIEWLSPLTPTARKPMVVELLGKSPKRVRLGSVTKPQNQGSYSVSWKIPTHFLENRTLSPDSLDFRISIRHGSELRNRFASRINLITIKKETPAQPAPNGNTESNPLPTAGQPGAELSDKSRFVARYTFKSQYEPWIVKKLTVVNDSSNDGFDPDPNEKTDVIDKVLLRYPDESGTLKTATAPYANGKAAFSGLDFHIPSRSTATLDLYVETVDPKTFGGQYSGKTYRMGIQDSSNTSDTFEAVGQVSDTTIYTLASFQVSGSPIGESVVQESVLGFSVADNTMRLTDGDNTLFDFTASSDQARLGRLVFDVHQDGLTALDGAKLYRNGQFLTLGDPNRIGDAYLMWDSGPSSCLASLAQNGPGTGMDCAGGTAPSSKLILTFSKEEILSGVTSFRLIFNVSGASVGDFATVRLSTGDDAAKPIYPGSDSVNAKIHNAGLDPELFANPTDFASEATSITDRNIIWSDVSADSHNYTTLSPAALPVSDSNSSADWTNGYLLKLNMLPATTTKR